MELQELMQLADFKKMEEIRARAGLRWCGDRRDRREAEALVQPVLQAALLPRRLPADVQPAERAPDRHRTATASSGSPRTGVWANGQDYEVDCLVYATGFEVGTELYARRAGYEVDRQGAA
jgi:hypothetical protein